MTSKELREKRAGLVVRMREINDKALAEGRDLNAEEQANWEAVNKEIDALGRQIERVESIERLEAEDKGRSGQEPGREDADGRESVRREQDGEDRSTGAPTPEQRVMALQAWARAATSIPLSPEHVAAVRACRINLAANEMTLPLFDGRTHNRVQGAFRSVHPNAVERALSTLDGDTGGYTIAGDFVRTLEQAILTFGGMRQVSTIIRTATGAPLEMPTANDTNNTGEQVGENADASSEANPAFAQLRLSAYLLSSKMVKVPYSLLQDSAFDMAAFLGNALGERLGRILNTKATTGDAAATFQGIITAATIGKTTDSATAIDPDELKDLVHSVDPGYRIGAGFMMHDNVLLALRKLRDGDGRYIWDNGMQVGQPDRLLGYPMTINQDMSSTITSGDKTVAFGQFSKYQFREAGSIRLRRLVERYAEYDQEAFIAFMRADGGLLDAGTHPVKLLVQA